MTKKTLFGLIIIYILTNCSSKPEITTITNNISTESNSFKSPFDTLDILKTPLILSPAIWNKLFIKHLEKYGIKDGWELLKYPSEGF